MMEGTGDHNRLHWLHGTPVPEPAGKRCCQAALPVQGLGESLALLTFPYFASETSHVTLTTT